MFPNTYFARSYFPGTYFPGVYTIKVVVTPSFSGDSGGGGGYAYVNVNKLRRDNTNQTNDIIMMISMIFMEVKKWRR